MGEPQLVFKKFPSVMMFDKPKSAIFTFNWSSNNKFSGFRVPVDNLMSMAIFDCGNDLLEKAPGFILRHSAALHNIVKKFLARVFDHHDNIVFGLDHIIKFDNVGMATSAITISHVLYGLAYLTLPGFSC